MSTSSNSLDKAFAKIDKIIQEEDKIWGKIDNEANFAFDILNNLKIHERNQRYESGYTPIDDMSDDEDDYKTYSSSSSSASSQYSLVSPASTLRSAMASSLRSPMTSTLRSPMTSLTLQSPMTSLTLQSPMTSLTIQSPMNSFTNEESASEHVHIIDFQEEIVGEEYNMNHTTRKATTIKEHISSFLLSVPRKIKILWRTIKGLFH